MAMSKLTVLWFNFHFPNNHNLIDSVSNCEQFVYLLIYVHSKY